MPVLHFITQIRQCRRCISTGRVSLNKTGSVLACVCWELLSLPSWGSSLVRTGLLARLLICSTHDHENEIEWKEELIKLLRTSENTLCVTQISTWELKRSLRDSRWLWNGVYNLQLCRNAAKHILTYTFQHEECYFPMLHNIPMFPNCPLISEMSVYFQHQGTGTPRSQKRSRTWKQTSSSQWGQSNLVWSSEPTSAPAGQTAWGGLHTASQHASDSRTETRPPKLNLGRWDTG